MCFNRCSRVLRCCLLSLKNHIVTVGSHLFSSAFLLRCTIFITFGLFAVLYTKLTRYAISRFSRVRAFRKGQFPSPQRYRLRHLPWHVRYAQLKVLLLYQYFPQAESIGSARDHRVHPPYASDTMYPLPGTC